MGLSKVQIWIQANRFPEVGKRRGGNALGAGMNGKRSLPAAQKGMAVLNIPDAKNDSRI